MQFADLDSFKWQQYAARTRGPLKWVYNLEARRLRLFECQIAASFTHSLLCTELERRDFEQLIPHAPVSVIGNGVDLEFFRSSGCIKNPSSMIFTGVMNYWPNVDAMLWFCYEILPKIRQQVPDANIIICGSHPTASVRRLGRIPGVRVTGWVPDT